MARTILSVAVLLGGLVVAIVSGQERAAQPAAPRELAPPSSAVPVPSPRFQLNDTNGPAAAAGVSADASRFTAPPGNIMAASAEGDEDGLRSVLKRRSAPPGAEPVQPFEDDDQFSSRRAPVTTSVNEPSAPQALPVPSGTAAMPSQRIATRPAAPPSAVVPPAGSGLRLVGASPNLRVEAAGPDAVTVGKPAAYRLTLTNDGPEAARDVVVNVSLPPWVASDQMSASAGDAAKAAAGSVVWTLPALPVNARAHLDLRLTTLEDRSFALNIDWSVRPAALSASIQVQKPALAVQITGPDDILFGARQIYTITISNPGTGPAENVNLDVATGGGGQAKQLGTIAPGGQEQVRMELIAREAGPLEIKATATGEGVRHESLKSILVRRAELAMEVTGPGLKFAGTTGSYEIRVLNRGNAPATNVAMAFRVPAGARFVGGIPGASENAGQVTWQLAALPPNAEKVFSIELAFEKAGVMQCEALASGEGDASASARCETRVEALADLKMTVNDPQGPKAVGDEVTYEIRVTNRGSKAATGVQVLGQFADGIEPVRAEGSPAEVVPGQVVFREIARIEAGQTVALTITARAEKAGNHRFRAVVKCPDPETELIAEDMTRFFGEAARTATGGSGNGTRR
jgi:uncharacterized repeat protein (TIGR01451 family)